MNTLNFDGFEHGMNSLVPDTELSINSKRGIEGKFLRGAVNVDILKNVAQRRAGVERKLTGADCHSLWTGPTAKFFVDGTTLKQLSGAADALAATTARTGLASGRRMSYVQANDLVYMSNGVDFLWLHDGVLEPHCPAGASTTWSTTDADGNVTQHAVAFEMSTGVPRLTAYQSAPNSSVLRDATGAICATVLLQPLPAGDILAFLNGRLFSALGSVLSFSEPYLLNLYNPGRNYIMFPAPITMVEPCQNGVFVSADQTYWIAGDPTVAELNPVLPYRAVRGTSGPVPNENSCYWLSERGIIVGTQTGEVKNLQEGVIATGNADSGAGLFREQNGIKQIVTPVSGPQDSIMAARSWMDAEVIRKETAL